MTNLRKTIEPNSNQLNADDLLGITRIIRINKVVDKETKDQPMWIYFHGDNGRQYKPGITMRKLLIYAWGDESDDWIGRSIELYNDVEVKFGPQKTGGIRISRLSHIDKDIKALLQTTRGKRAEFVVGRLPTYPEAAFAEKSPQWVAAIKAGKITLDEVIDKAAATGILTESQIGILKGAVENGN